VLAVSELDLIKPVMVKCTLCGCCIMLSSWYQYRAT